MNLTHYSCSPPIRTAIVAGFLAVLAHLAAGSPAQAEPKLLRLKFQTDERFRFESDQQLSQTVVTDGVSRKLTSQTRFWWEVTVEKTGGESTTLRFRFDRLAQHSETYDDKFDFDSADTSSKQDREAAAAHDRALRALVGLTVTQTLDARGRITAREISDDDRRRLASSPLVANFNANSGETTESGLQLPFLSSGGGKTEGLWPVLPAAPVKPGASWEVEGRLSAGARGALLARSRYTYAEDAQHDGRPCAVIRWEAQLAPAPQGGELSEKMKIEKQSATGQLFFDIESGRFRESSHKIQLQASLALGESTTTAATTCETTLRLMPAKN